MSDSPEHSANFYNAQAQAYDHTLAQDKSHALVRQRFYQFVQRTQPQPSTLLDFGCGTGIDAKHYAAAQWRVIAYDNAKSMLAQLHTRCQTAIQSGRVQVIESDYPSFLRDHLPHLAPHLVVANFAVLNTLENPQTLFQAFAKNQNIQQVLVNVLNPFYAKNWLHPRHCFATLREMSWRRKARIHVHYFEAATHKTCVHIYEHWVSHLRQLAQPHWAISQKTACKQFVFIQFSRT